MTTTTLVAYAEESDLVELERELLDSNSPVRISDFRRTGEGFPFEIIISFEGGSKEMREAKAFIAEKLNLPRWK